MRQKSVIYHHLEPDSSRGRLKTRCVDQHGNVRVPKFDVDLAPDPACQRHHYSGSLSLDNIFYRDKSRARIDFLDVIVSMPDPLARQWGDNPQAIARGLKEDAVLERYRTGKLSHRQVGEALGLETTGGPRPSSPSAACRSTTRSPTSRRTQRGSRPSLRE
jgi:hypothetical protein